MVAYRFCRPDDIPLLVDAVNRCWGAHFPAAPALTVEDFRREMRELHLWPSNCMVARAGDEPVGVVLGTKRPREVMVRRIGIAPGHQRNGYGRHLLDSLSQKLAVLGPPRLIAEVPGSLPAAAAFFAAAGWRQEVELLDLERAAPTASARPAEPAAFLAIDVASLDAMGLLPTRLDLAWERQAETLRAAAPQLAALAVAGAERLEAWVIYRPGSPVDLLALGGTDADRTAVLLRHLLDHLQAQHGEAIRLRGLLPDELSSDLLAGLGFAPAGTTLRFATEAVAA